ncbi:MAG: hypothetical protein AAFP76_14575 [Bacteroidota bacterium]
MAVRSDFNVVPIREHLGDNAGDINTDFPFRGRNSTRKEFRIEGDPVDDAYLLINHSNVNSSAHVIKINDTDLPWLDILDADDKFASQTKLIPPGLLRRGTNSVQIQQKGTDNIIVYDVIIHWREEE